MSRSWDNFAKLHFLSTVALSSVLVTDCCQWIGAQISFVVNSTLSYCLLIVSVRSFGEKISITLYQGNPIGVVGLVKMPCHLLGRQVLVKNLPTETMVPRAIRIHSMVGHFLLLLPFLDQEIMEQTEGVSAAAARSPEVPLRRCLDLRLVKAIVIYCNGVPLHLDFCSGQVSITSYSYV